MRRYIASLIFALVGVSAFAAIPMDRHGISYVRTGDGGWRAISGGMAGPRFEVPGEVPLNGLTGSPAANSVVRRGPDLALSTRGTIPTGPGKGLIIDVEAKLVKASVGAALGRAALKALPGVNVAVALVELMTDLGMQRSGTDANGDASWKVDEPVMEQTCGFGPSQSPCGASLYPGYAATSYPIGVAWNGVPMCFWANANGTYGGIPGSCTSPVQVMKPRVLTEPEISQKIQESVDSIESNNKENKIIPAVRELLKGSSADRVAVQTPTVTGPATSPGETKTTQNADGTTTTTTSTNNYSYSGDTITVNNVTVTNKFDSTTNTTTTTTTTTENPKPEDPVDPCETNPNRVGCASLGTPEGAELRKDTYNVSVTPVAFATGSCPPSIALSVFSKSYEISYQPMCNQLELLKFLFLAMAGFVAAYVLADSFRMN